MLIKSQFPATCRKCKGAIAKGEDIEYERGVGASHLDCNGQKAPGRTPEEIAAACGFVNYDAASLIEWTKMGRQKQQGDLF